ncbi:MAG: hypothetical protein CSA65_02595 [Proteobacteria bacterium]|nr:MAG: hypothetical protein CSB49_04130 [Pseudomonadota bacterium]PIE19388.1 MAG: hypothetical protein CSA65_02595 [Pseudomonadota bacterium]
MKTVSTIGALVLTCAFSGCDSEPRRLASDGGLDVSPHDGPKVNKPDGQVPLPDVGVEVFPGENPGGGTIYYVAPSGKNTNAGTEAAPWKTLQHAADQVEAGDMVAVKAGSYSDGFELTTSGTAAKPITFRGEGASKVTITGGGQDTIYLDHADHVNIEQLSVMNASRAGLRLSFAHHVAVRRSVFGDNGTWGIFTDFSDDTTIEDCETYGSKAEHGIYISNSCDRAIIRRNRSHDNNAGGIQINADPSMGGDGISSDCVIDSNIIYNNGQAGGAAINLASVRDTVISNNVLYNNKAGGIAGWDDGQGSNWGSKNVTIINNTIYFKAGQGRWCVSMKDGSTGAIIRNNILFGGERGGIEVDDTTEASLEADHNLFLSEKPVAENEDGQTFPTLADWKGAGKGAGSLTGSVTAVCSGIASGDAHLEASAPAIDKGVATSVVGHDFEGDARPQGGGYDIGADESQ